MSVRGRSLPWLLGAAALLCALFSALGVWQVQRLAWKKDLIARVEARVRAAPQPPPPAGSWPAVLADPAAFEYRRIELQGRFAHQHEALTQALGQLGAGYWVLTPLELSDGSLVWINRGFVPPEARAAEARGASAPQGQVRVVGLLRLSEPQGGFLRRNAPAEDRWHSRDIAALSAARGLPQGRVAPYFIDAEAALPPGQWPAGGQTVLRFSDNHLVYALTWFALAGMSVGAGVLLLRQGRRAAAG